MQQRRRNGLRFWPVVLLPLLLCVGAVQQAFAQRTIHVPVDVSTIQGGIVAAQDGDTVLVAPGTYAERLNFLGKNITVTSGATSYQQAASTVIEVAGKGEVVSFRQGEIRASTFNGFTIRNATGTAVYIRDASPTISNNAIIGTHGCAIGIIDFTASPLITRNRIAAGLSGDCGPSNGGSIASLTVTPGYQIAHNDLAFIANLIEKNTEMSDSTGEPTAVIFGNTLRFEGNTIRYNNGLGMVSLSVGSFAQADLIGNLVYANTSHDLVPETPVRQYPGTTAGVAMGDNVHTDRTVNVLNNTIFGNYKSGYTGSGAKYGNTFFLEQSSGKAHFHIENNVFGEISGDAPVACSFYNVDLSDFTWINNDLFNYGTPLGTSGCFSTGPIPAGDLTADPIFADRTNADYHLASGSTLISAGDPKAPLLPATDIAGKNRVTCGKVDIGAYQTHPHPPIVLTVMPNPVAGGSPVTLQAVLTGNCNVPTGDVTFTDNGGTTIGTGTLNGLATATLTTSFLTVGSHHIVATYPGDFNFEDSTSNAIDLTVTGLPTATALTVKPNPAKAFQPVTLTANVTDPYVPVTGSVTFMANGKVLGTAPLTAGGIAAISTSQLAAGSYTVVATFNATTQFASSSASVLLQVDGAPTSTTLRSSLNPSLYGQSVAFTAVVTQSGSTVVPQGSVTFRDGGALLGTAVLDGSGTASFMTDRLSVGSHPITAEFTGSPNANPSTSTVLVQVVNPVTVQLVLTASPNPARVGEVVNLQLQLTANNGVAPTGTANFFEGPTLLGSAPIANGAAMLPVSTFSMGKHFVTAHYASPGNGVALNTAAVTVEVLNYDFAVSSSGTRLNIPFSGYAEVTLMATPLGSYDRSVHFTCSGLPEAALCNFDREWSEPLSKGPQRIRLIVNANMLLQYGPRGDSTALLHWPGGVLAAVVLLTPRRKRSMPFLVLVLVGTTAFLAGCSGKLPASTPRGEYTILVQATDTMGLSHSVPLHMTVR